MDADKVLPSLSRQVAALCHAFKPSHVQIALDRPGRNWRSGVWPDYKANRTEKDQSLVSILHESHAHLLGCGWDVDGVPGYEADDLIATWCKEVMLGSEQAVVVSCDRDLYQLLRHGRVLMLTRFGTHRGELASRSWFNYSMFVAEYFIEPQQWPEWRALVGDKSDGMNGVPGIGDGMATKLMAKFGSLLAIAEAVGLGVKTSMSDRQVAAFREHWANGDLEKWVNIHTLVDSVPFCEAVA